MMPTKFMLYLSLAAVAVTLAFLLTHVAVPMYFHFILMFANV